MPTAPTALVPVEPAVHTYVLHLKLVKMVQEWTKRRGDLLNVQRYGPTCMTMALAAPWAPAADLDVVCRQALLLWAVDDELEAVADEARFRARLAEFTSAISGEPYRPDPLNDALAELRADLVARPLFGELGQWWTDTMIDGWVAGFDEWRISREMAAGAPAPGYEDYLKIGTRSILKTPMQLAMLMVTEQASLHSHRNRLNAAIDEANIAVRLVNDYASYERERRSGDLNVMMLGLTEDQVRQEIHASVDRFREHLGPLLAEPNPLRAAVTLWRYLQTPVSFYLRIDYLS
ncbi:terpene synthase family protein [Lentzea sp. NPDC051838]|uniref:terpene synthase family protein n=1 Tax=Lentzea sp. NPDC051838 TaxID=3154849 RepID=UPI003412E805